MQTPDAFQPVLGFLSATVATTVLYVAQAVDQIPPQARGWMEMGGTLGLIGGLSYGCVTLWKEVQSCRREMAAERAGFIAAKDSLEKEIRTEWKAQNEKLISVLDRLDSDR